jgi:hypothetical protein
MVDVGAQAFPDPHAGSVETRKRFATLMAAVAAVRRPPGAWDRPPAGGGGNEREFLFAITLPDQGAARSAVSPIGVVGGGRRAWTDGGGSRWN